MLKNSKIIPFLIASIIIHIIALFFVAQKAVKPIFISAPIDVTFYTLSDEKTDMHTTVPQQAAPAKVESKKEKDQVKQDVKIKEPSKSIAKKENAKAEAKTETAPKNKDEIKTKAIKEKQQKPAEKQPQETKTEAAKKVDEKANNPQSAAKEKTQSAPAATHSQVQTVQAPSSNVKYGAAGSQYENIAFDAKDFDYAYYERTIVNKIGRFWEWTESYEKLRTIVYFRILKNGDVDESSIKIVESSKNRNFDENARNSILKASPFGELPAAYNGDSIGVYFEFKYR
jgi:outer membrane biosynthesis protein TonB